MSAIFGAFGSTIEPHEASLLDPIGLSCCGRGTAPAAAATCGSCHVCLRAVFRGSGEPHRVGQ